MQEELILDHIWRASTKTDLEKKGDENMLGSQKETELKGGKKSAFQVIWNREGRRHYLKTVFTRANSLKKKWNICESHN